MKKEPGPKSNVLAAMDKISSANSYEFSKSIQFNELSTNIVLSNQMEESKWIFSFLNKSQVHMTGIYQKSPHRMEMTVEFITGDEIPKSILMPVLVTEDTTYIQIADLPDLNIPPETIGKFIEIDRSQSPLNKEHKDTEHGLLRRSLAHFNEEPFFKKTFKNANMSSSDNDIQQTYTFTVTEDNLDQLIEVFVKEFVPVMLDLISDKTKIGYILGDKRIDNLETRLREVQQRDIQSWLDGVSKSFNLNNIQITSTIDKDGFLRSEESIANLAYLNGNDFFKLDMIYSERYSKLNEPAQFRMVEPANIIHKNELDALLQNFKHEMEPKQYDLHWIH